MDIMRWVESYLAGYDCQQCKRPLALKDLLTVGVQRPPEDQVHDQRPLAVVIARCCQCKSLYQLTGYQDKDEILADVGAFFEMLDYLREKTEQPSPLKKMLDAAKTRAPKPSPAPAVSADGTKILRPSRRPGAPDRPLTVQEIEVFLRRLKVASFRPGTGFDRWLKRMERESANGHDPGCPEGPPPF